MLSSEAIDEVVEDINTGRWGALPEVSMLPIYFGGERYIGNSISAPTDIEIENTPTLRQASLDVAMRYGGTLTRRALEAMNLRHDREHIVVDTKVHFLMPGWCPSIPGWHNDGTPRGKELDPAGDGAPDIWAQASLEAEGKLQSPRYHLLVSGANSLTSFLQEPSGMYYVNLPTHPTHDLYAIITEQIKRDLESGHIHKWIMPENTVVEWGWWELHTAEWANARGWRYLIRVTETDHIKPRTSLDDVFRYQNLAFVKSDEVGW